MEHIEATPAKTSSFVTDHETIKTSIKTKNGNKYPMNKANGPSDFSKATFTFSPFLNLSPGLIISMTLLSISETEQVALVWHVAQEDTLRRLTFIDFGVISLITPQCSMELLIVADVIALYL